MVVSLLKIELLSAAETLDSSEFYNGEHLISFCYLGADNRSTSSNDTHYCPQRHQLQDDHAPYSQIERA
jgi:hypothetical protein